MSSARKVFNDQIDGGLGGLWLESGWPVSAWFAIQEAQRPDSWRIYIRPECGLVINTQRDQGENPRWWIRQPCVDKAEEGATLWEFIQELLIARRAAGASPAELSALLVYWGLQQPPIVWLNPPSGAREGELKYARTVEDCSIDEAAVRALGTRLWQERGG